MACWFVRRRKIVHSPCGKRATIILELYPRMHLLLNDIDNPALTEALQHRLNNKTKPLGSLGRLEDVALKIGQILGSTAPVLDQPQMVVFAGDTASRRTAYRPSRVM